MRISGISCCNLETRSVIWSSVILLETPDCLERDLLLDIVVQRECQKEIVDKGEREVELKLLSEKVCIRKTNLVGYGRS